MNKQIIHIITRLDRGGSSEDVLYNCIHFQKKGHSLKIIYGKTSLPEQKLTFIAKSLNVEFIQIPYLIRNINPLYDIKAFLKIYFILCKKKPDIVHTHTSKAGITGRWAAWFYKLTHNKISIFHSTHGHIFYGYYNTFISKMFIFIEKITSFITDKIIVLTENEINEHLKYGISKKEKFFITHSGIEYKTISYNNDLKKQLNINEDNLIIGSVGRLDPVKGYFYFIEAIKIIQQKNDINPDTLNNLQYLIVGDGTEKELILNLISKYNLTNKILLTGWQNNVEDFISIMDIYIQPSLNEGFGKTIITAQMAGKPVIASNVQGIVSIIKNSETGMLIEPKNPLTLADTIIYLIQNKNFRLQLGNNAKKNIFTMGKDSSFYKYSVEYMNFLSEKLYLDN